MDRRTCGHVGLCMAVMLAGCAAELARSPVSFAPLATGASPVLRVREAVSVTPGTGYTKIIKAGSTWRLIGATPQGEVYRPVGEVFAVEGANMHEAYLVIAGGQVVGFYLPGERAFAPLAGEVPFPTE